MHKGSATNRFVGRVGLPGEPGIVAERKTPVERELSQILGFSRGKLRKALSVLIRRRDLAPCGLRHSTGPRPVQNLEDVSFLSSQTSLSEIMEARMAVEPELARLAALNGTDKDFEKSAAAAAARRAQDWRTYEAWDTNLHLAIAKASQNGLLISLFDTPTSCAALPRCGRCARPRGRRPATRVSSNTTRS